MKNQSGDPMFGVEPLPMDVPSDRWFKALKYHLALEYPVAKAELNFEEQSQKVYDLVHDQLRPAMKKMTGRYYQKMLDDMTKIEELIDQMRREAGNRGL